MCVVDFSVDFWILAEESGWEEKALQRVFLNSLNEGLRRELATKQLPKLLGELIDMCIRLDDNMQEYGKRSGESRARPPPMAWQRKESEPEDKEEERMQFGWPQLSSSGHRRRHQMGEFAERSFFADACLSWGKEFAHQ